MAGRYTEIPIHSLTYGEFLQFHRLEDTEGSLQAYLRVGGLPGLKHFDLSDESQVRDYLQGVYNTVMLRDVIARESIRNVPFIEKLAAFTADNVGKLISKYVVSMDPVSGGLPQYPGIRHLHLREFLRMDLKG
ncbi:MAG: hypothetical protein LUB83_04200 [Prevotellaceae bacterium]|nr:hypothetical protein [Prevotellaceae bacterium]